MSKNEGNGWRNWGDHPLVVLISVIASLVAIAGFISGYDNIQELIKLIMGNNGAEATPTSTSTPTPPDTESTSVLYDDFNNKSFDGKFNTGLWIPDLTKTCDVYQREGMLVFENELSQTEEAFCNINIKNPRLIQINELGTFEARVKIANDHSGGYINQGIQYGTNETSSGYWATYCGLNASQGGAKSEFEVWTSAGGVEIHTEIKASYDTWFNARLEINPETMEIKCFADNLLVGSIIPKNASELKTAYFERYLNMFRSKNTLATSYTDDIKLIP